MTDEVLRVAADEEKLRAVLSERGLPDKLEARLNQVERKVHELLCAGYDFATNRIMLEMPDQTLRRLTPELRKLWDIRPGGRGGSGKVEVVFSLTPAAIRRTFRTARIKDAAIFRPKINRVRLHADWSAHLKPKVKTETAPASIDWSQDEARAKRHNAAVVEDIMDGKTFNARKDNPWARKHLKNRQQ
jgi:hypothetical protein